MRKTIGFTLIEILVALAIVAVALVAGFRILAQSVDGAVLLRERTFALWVAQNQLAIVQLLPSMPAIGEESGNAAEGGSQFIWRRVTSGTPNPAFRKLEITVAAPDAPDYALARLVGYVAQGGRR